MSATQLAGRVRVRIDGARFRRGVGPTGRPDLVRLGSAYGGWTIPDELVEAGWTCYSAGVGEDITFDLALIARYGCTIWAFDPTPRSAAYAAEAAPRERFRFLPYGVWSRDELRRFYGPSNSSHVSHSIANRQRSSEYFEAPCRRIDSLAAELGHDRVDLLKMDIEGAELEVLRSLDLVSLGVKVLCVEFHKESEGLEPLLNTVALVRAQGLDPVHVHGTDVTFVASSG